jgi:hypothetical protein
VIRLSIFTRHRKALEGVSRCRSNTAQASSRALTRVRERREGQRETDIDCGGGFCMGRCIDGQNCVNDDDCLSDVCGIDMGFKKCFGP